MVDVVSRLPAVPVASTDLQAVSQFVREPVQPEKNSDEADSSPATQAVENMLRSLDPPLMGRNERLSIQRDEATGTFIYKSIAKDTGEVLNQWPAESMLQFKAYLKEAQGVLFDAEI